MKNTPIIIPCHWHTGSSLLSNVFNRCGMNVGNEKTYWNKLCFANCEHYLLNNTIAAVVNNEHKDVNQNIDQVKLILESYKREALVNSWKFYGVKTTHLLQSWTIFGKIFQSCWPDAIYVIGIQHPLRIAKTLQATPHGEKYDKKDLYDYVAKSWLSSYKGVKEILAGSAYIIDYPISWQQNKIKIIINDIGLNYQNGAMFKKTKIYKMGKVEKKEFGKQYPEAIEIYHELSKLSEI